MATNTPNSDTTDSFSSATKALENMLSKISAHIASNTPTGDEKKFVDLLTIATHFVEKNHVPLISDSGTFQAMIHLLNTNIEGLFLPGVTWRAIRALEAAETFVRNDKNVRMEDRATLKKYVNELVRIGLILTETTGLTKPIQGALAKLIPLTNERQYTSVWQLLTDAMFEFVPTTPDLHCLIVEVAIRMMPANLTDAAKYFQGELANEAYPFVTRAFETIAKMINWAEPFELKEVDSASEVTYNRGNVTHELRHLLELFERLVVRTPKERQFVMNFFANIVNRNGDAPWVVPLADIVIDSIMNQRKINDITTETQVVQFMRLKNNLLIEKQ
jgi:hypothetical protein